VYADVVSGDYELDRLSLFLNRLYNEDKELFASVLGHVTKELLERFHEPKENLSSYFQELKELSSGWDAMKLAPSTSLRAKANFLLAAESRGTAGRRRLPPLGTLHCQ
jgi:hypothetical protein